ncbi:hypothetical protein ACFLZM_04380, partial [Thermodesulfobacteriota bacterium]
MKRAVKKKYALMLALAGAVLFFGVVDQAKASVNSNRNAGSDQAPQIRVSERFVRLPLTFEANLGQVRPGVDFLARGAGYSLLLMPTEARLALKKPLSEKSVDKKEAARYKHAVVSMKLDGVAPTPK